MTRSRNPVAKIAFFLLLILLVAGVGALLIFESPCVDDETGCPCEAGHTEATLTILLDATDPYGAAQQRAIINVVWDEVDALAVDDRVKVYTVQRTPGNPDFNLCKPGQELRDSPVQNRLREARFKKFLDDSLRKIQGTRPSSPIIASLGWVAADHERDGSSKRILPVSDLIENSDVLSQYAPKWRHTYERNRKRIHDQCPILDGIDMDILFPTRPGRTTQNNDLVQWWLDYLRACVGRVESVRKMTGTN